MDGVNLKTAMLNKSKQMAAVAAAANGNGNGNKKRKKGADLQPIVTTEGGTPVDSGSDGLVVT